MFGSHLSIAGGIYHAVVEAHALGFQTVQIFTRNQQQWRSPPLTADAIGRFRNAMVVAGFSAAVAHDSYLTNLASGDEQLRQKSIAAFSAELQRCDQLGVSYLVTHTGAHGGAGENTGIRRIVDSLNNVLEQNVSGSVIICLETTAGQGTSIGWRFEHMRDIIAGVKRSDRLGVCLDTCHILAAGYDVTTFDGTMRVLDEFDRIIGLKRLRIMHFNDSLKPLGSRVDRHTHIGRGYVGLPAFECICRDKRFLGVPKILETPKALAPDGRAWDTINLDLLRALTAGEKVLIEPMENKSGPISVQIARKHPAGSKQ
jgi:deoxyribonuclease IV